MPLGERNCELGPKLSDDYDHAEIGAFLGLVGALLSFAPLRSYEAAVALRSRKVTFSLRGGRS